MAFLPLLGGRVVWRSTEESGTWWPRAASPTAGWQDDTGCHPMDRPKYLFHFIVLNRFFNFNLSFLEREVGEEHGEGENLKQAPQPVCSPTWGSIS